MNKTEEKKLYRQRYIVDIYDSEQYIKAHFLRDFISEDLASFGSEVGVQEVDTPEENIDIKRMSNEELLEVYKKIEREITKREE